MISEIYKEVAEDLSKLGVEPGGEFKLTYNEIMNLGAQALEEIDIAAFEELLERISSYNIFLKSQKGSLEAQIVVLDSELRRNLYLETQNVDPRNGSSWLTKEEKESLILTGNEVVKDLYRKSLVLKAKIAKIKDIPFAIDKKLELLKLKYRRRCQNASY